MEHAAKFSCKVDGDKGRNTVDVVVVERSKLRDSLFDSDSNEAVSSNPCTQRRTAAATDDCCKASIDPEESGALVGCLHLTYKLRRDKHTMEQELLHEKAKKPERQCILM